MKFVTILIIVTVGCLVTIIVQDMLRGDNGLLDQLQSHNQRILVELNRNSACQDTP